MKDKNGFIATSILYAFLLAFLTLFLAYTANYIQNKQLINRVKLLAQNDLEKYGNNYITDMKIGDYAVFDIVQAQGNGYDAVTTYSSPINANTKWILFKIDEGTVGETEADSTPSKYYFVSDITAQYGASYFTSYTGSFDTEGNPVTTLDVNGSSILGNLRNIERIFTGNVYYSGAARRFYSFATKEEANEKKETGDSSLFPVYSFAFNYRVNNGVTVRPMTIQDVYTIKEIDDEKIIEAILNQNSNYMLWNSTSSDPDAANTYTGTYSYGWHTYARTPFVYGGAVGIENGADANRVNSACGSTDATSDGSRMTYNNSNGDNTFGKVMNDSYVEYCYHITTNVGSCVNGSSSACTGLSVVNKPRLVATVEVYESNNNLNGAIDSGNGTLQLPYLISKGVR